MRPIPHLTGLQLFTLPIYFVKLYLGSVRKNKMRLATLAYTKPDARYDVIEFEAPVFRERIITTMRRKNKISFSLISNSQSSGRLPISLPDIAIFL